MPNASSKRLERALDALFVTLLERCEDGQIPGYPPIFIHGLGQWRSNSSEFLELELEPTSGVRLSAAVEVSAILSVMISLTWLALKTAVSAFDEAGAFGPERFNVGCNGKALTSDLGNGGRILSDAVLYADAKLILAIHSFISNSSEACSKN
jgi:hypothetical protein